jgi:hypothetical protein
MNLCHYQLSELEQWINHEYQEHGIHSASALDLQHVASIFHVELVRWSGHSHARWDDDFRVIFLSEHLDEEHAREVFFHELCHPLKHVGNQQRMPHAFHDLQEIQAGLFQLYAALPFYLIIHYEDVLHSSNAVPLLAYEFKLPPGLVQRRLEQIAARIRKAQEEQAIFHSVPRYPEPRIIPHSSDTLKLLGKLSWQSAQKGKRVNWTGTR